MKKTVLHYLETGSPDSPVIVFLHGFMGRAQSWQPVMERLSDAFRLIAFALPGHGKSLFNGSERLKQLCGLEDTARLILEDLDSLGISRFTLYGYSMGGRIAQHITLASPQRIEKLILESSSFGIADPVQRAERLKRDQALMAEIKTPDEFQVFLRQWNSLPLFRTLQGTPYPEKLIGERGEHPFAEYRQALNILSVGRQAFLAGHLVQCLIPVHYFCGQEDEAYMETARQMKNFLPEMILTIFKKASHNISIQYPEEIARSIRKILI